MRRLLIGNSASERKYRFVLWSGILALTSLFTSMAMLQIDGAVREQSQLLELSPDQTMAGELVPMHGRGPAWHNENTVRADPLTRAIHRRRANLIAWGLVASMLTMVYSGAVLRHIFADRPRRENAQRELKLD